MSKAKNENEFGNPIQSLILKKPTYFSLFHASFYVFECLKKKQNLCKLEVLINHQSLRRGHVPRKVQNISWLIKIRYKMASKLENIPHIIKLKIYMTLMNLQLNLRQHLL